MAAIGIDGDQNGGGAIAAEIPVVTPARVDGNGKGGAEIRGVVGDLRGQWSSSQRFAQWTNQIRGHAGP